MENTAFSSLLIASAITTNGTMTKSSTPARGGHSAICVSLPSSSCKGWLLAWWPGSRLVGFYREIEASHIPIPIVDARCPRQRRRSHLKDRLAQLGRLALQAPQVERLFVGECRQTCMVACEANERILNTFATGRGGNFIFEEENRATFLPQRQEPRPK